METGMPHPRRGRPPTIIARAKVVYELKPVVVRLDIIKLDIGH